MIADAQGNALPHFQVGRPYGREHIFETQDLYEAVLVCVAASLHRGTSYEVRRLVPKTTDSSQCDAFSLFTATPNTVDFRKVKPETVLGMKAFASSLVANIEDVAPAEKEGFDK